LVFLHAVVTIRTYSNPAEAAMAKSLLDSHDIFCRLADENVNLYGGGPLAMPIRLLVTEDQAQQAIRVLETRGPALPADFDPGTPIEMQTKKEDSYGTILSELRRLYRANQWVFVIGIAILAIVLYLVFETPRETDPWQPIYQAIQRHQYERALNLTRQIINERPDDYYGREYLGYIYSQMGKLDQAELEYSRAYDLATKELNARLDALRKRRDRIRDGRLSVTPVPSAASIPLP
jgi:tetratricopeptide (TPR) repeat protein